MLVLLVTQIYNACAWNKAPRGTGGLHLPVKKQKSPLYLYSVGVANIDLRVYKALTAQFGNNITLARVFIYLFNGIFFWKFGKEVLEEIKKTIKLKALHRLYNVFHVQAHLNWSFKESLKKETKSSWKFYFPYATFFGFYFNFYFLLLTKFTEKNPVQQKYKTTLAQGEVMQDWTFLLQAIVHYRIQTRNLKVLRCLHCQWIAVSWNISRGKSEKNQSASLLMYT